MVALNSQIVSSPGSALSSDEFSLPLRVMYVASATNKSPGWDPKDPSEIAAPEMKCCYRFGAGPWEEQGPLAH